MITKGQKINDRYEIIRSIGEGGMANVYLGYDTKKMMVFTILLWSMWKEKL